MDTHGNDIVCMCNTVVFSLQKTSETIRLDKHFTRKIHEVCATFWRAETRAHFLNFWTAMQHLRNFPASNTKFLFKFRAQAFLIRCNRLWNRHNPPSFEIFNLSILFRILIMLLLKYKMKWNIFRCTGNDSPFICCRVGGLGNCARQFEIAGQETRRRAVRNC